MGFSEDLVALVDQRVRAATQPIRAVGTCVSRDTTGPGADVIMDGSTVAVPVKVLGNVFLRPEDRCVLDLYGSDWVVTGSYSALGLGESARETFGPSGGTAALSSATYVDVSEIPPITFDKAFDGTFVRMGLDIGCYLETTANANVRFGFRLTATDASSTFVATDYNLCFLRVSAINIHERTTSFARFTGIPAGRYSVQLRWRRLAGTGTFKLDNQDLIAMEIDERVRASAPIL